MREDELEKLRRELERLRALLGKLPVRLSIGGGGASRVLVKVTGSATGGGKYNGKLLTAPASLTTATGNLAESDLGTVPGSDDALVLNCREVGQTTHDLSSSSYLPLVFAGELLGVNSDGKYVVAIDGYQWKACVPA
jgi:hypothetical protein